MLAGRSRTRGLLVALSLVCLVGALLAGSALGASAPRRPLPDFVVTKVSRPPASLSVGQSFSLSIRSANVGDRAAGLTKTRFFVSADRRRNRGDVGLTGSLKLGRVRVGRRAPGTITLAVAPVLPGSYFVLACADATGRARERDERNNCRASPSRMVVRGPALVGVGGPAVGSGTPAGPGAPAGGSGAPTGSPPSVVDADGDGYTTAIDCNDADRAVHPGAADAPDFAFADSNCDGIDGDEARAVFVSPSGDDAAPGTRAVPKRSLADAVARAAAAGKDVYASSGTYAETLSAADGVGVYGGYGAGWARALTNETRITGPPGGSEAAVASNIAGATTLALLTFAPGAPAAAGSSSFGLRALSSPGLVLERITATAASGAPGAVGAAGRDGGPGTDGQPGGVGACDATGGGFGGGAGIGAAGRPGGPGGAGGADGRVGSAGRLGWGADGIRGSALGGPGGPGGAVGDSSTPGGTGAAGQDGAAGRPGDDGVGGSGGFVTPGALWVTSAGALGALGGPGLGGGGGGGGGGQVCAFFCTDGTGNGGGGGGGGGEGGRGGLGGGGGGGSFGVLLLDSSGVVIRNSAIAAADGGAGGPGGAGGTGALGGDGGLGRTTCVTQVGAGGNGGAGGDGASGGDAGGGAGGPSVALLTVNTTVTASGTTLSFGTGGAGGGGPGGAGQPGRSGAS